MLTARQYRAKAAEYTELLKAASLPAETREFRRREQSYLTLAENAEWMADNLDKIDIPGADENWYGGAIVAQEGEHKGTVSMAKSKSQAKRDDKEQSKLFIEKDRSMAQVRGAVYPPPMKGLLPIAVILHENEVIGARAVPSDQDGEAILATMMLEFAGMVGHKARGIKDQIRTLLRIKDEAAN